MMPAPLVSTAKATTITPSFDQFRVLANTGNVIPVVATFVADIDTPISAFAKLRQRGPCFLFESAEKSEESGRFSFIGAEPRLSIESRGDRISIFEDANTHEFTTASDPLTELEQQMARFRIVPHPELPSFVGGAVGFAGFDVVRFFEPSVRIHPRDDLGLPELAFMIPRLMVVFDHRLRKMHVVSHVFVS